MENKRIQRFFSRFVIKARYIIDTVNYPDPQNLKTWSVVTIGYGGEQYRFDIMIDINPKRFSFLEKLRYRIYTVELLPCGDYGENRELYENKLMVAVKVRLWWIPRGTLTKCIINEYLFLLDEERKRQQLIKERT